MALVASSGIWHDDGTAIALDNGCEEHLVVVTSGGLNGTWVLYVWLRADLMVVIVCMNVYAVRWMAT